MLWDQWDDRGSLGGGVNWVIAGYEVRRMVQLASFHETVAKPVSPQDQYTSWQRVDLQAFQHSGQFDVVADEYVRDRLRQSLLCSSPLAFQLLGENLGSGLT